MDRRFLAATRSLFQNLTGFKEDEYYHEAFAGGALGTLADLPDLAAKATPPLVTTPPAANGADYVYNRSFNDLKDITLVVMGWQVHLDHCGGLPNLHENADIQAAFQNLINARTLQNKYSKVQKHIFMVLPSSPWQPSTGQPTTLTFDNSGTSYNAWYHVNYTDPNGPFVTWDSGQFGQTTSSTSVPSGATNITLEGGAIGGGFLFNPVRSLNSLPAGTTTITFAGSQATPTYSGI